VSRDSLIIEYADWALDVEEDALERGQPLNWRMRAIAWDIGVIDMDRVRVLSVPEIPFPIHNPFLCVAAEQLGFRAHGFLVQGQVFGHAILIAGPETEWTVALLAHELTHVAQVERAGSFLDFLTQYLGEVEEFGYANSPLEREAHFVGDCYRDESYPTGSIDDQ